MVAFAPQEPSDFFEPLHLTYGEGSFLNLTFSGKGVTCDVDVEGIERGVIDFGHVLSGDVVTKMLKVRTWLCVHTVRMYVHYCTVPSCVCFKLNSVAVCTYVHMGVYVLIRIYAYVCRCVSIIILASKCIRT